MVCHSESLLDGDLLYRTTFSLQIVLDRVEYCHPSFYMDCLSESLGNTQTGSNVGGVKINHLMYADDLGIISPSVKGLQGLLDICALYGQNHDILCDHSKTVCMYMPSGNCYYLNTPVVVLNGIQLAFVRTYKYLGTVMTCDNADDEEIKCRQAETIGLPLRRFVTRSGEAPRLRPSYAELFCKMATLYNIVPEFES